MSKILPSWLTDRSTNSSRKKKRRRKRSYPSARLDGVPAQIRIENLEPRVLLAAFFRTEAPRLVGYASVKHDFPDFVALDAKGNDGQWSLGRDPNTNHTLISTKDFVVNFPDSSQLVAPLGVTADVTARTYTPNNGALYLRNSYRAGASFSFTIPEKPFVANSGPFARSTVDVFRIHFQAGATNGTTDSLRLGQFSSADLQSQLEKLAPLSNARIQVERTPSIPSRQAPSGEASYSVYISGNVNSLQSFAEIRLGLSNGPNGFGHASSRAGAAVPLLPLSRSGIVKAAGNEVTSISDPAQFALINAPFFTPTRLDGKSLQGTLSASDVEGEFHPTSALNVTQTAVPQSSGSNQLGYRVTDVGSDYTLNPKRDPLGKSQPFSTFQAEGLTWTLAPAMPFILRSTDSTNDTLFFDSKSDSVLATASFEGGSITMRVMKDGNTPAVRAHLSGNGRVELSGRREFVSANIGGLALDPAKGVSATFNPAIIKTLTTPQDQFRIDSGNVRSGSNGSTLLDGDPNTIFAYDHTTELSTFITPAVGREVVTGLTITTSPTGQPGLDPDTYEIRGDDTDGKPNGIFASGTLIASGRLDLPAARGVSKTISFTNSTAYRSYHVVLKKSNFGPSGNTEIGDLKLLASAPGYEVSLNNAVLTGGEPTGIAASGGQRFDTFRGLGRITTHVRTPTGFIQASQYVGKGKRGSIIEIIDLGDFAKVLQHELAAIVRSGNQSLLPANISSLSQADRDRIAGRIEVVYRPVIRGSQSASITVRGFPAELYMDQPPLSGRFKLPKQVANRTQLPAPTSAVANPVQLTIPSATFGIRNGKLDPISGARVTGLQTGRTVIDSNGVFQTTYKPFRLGPNGSLTMSYYQRNTYDAAGVLRVPGNSFGLYGAQVPIDLPVVSGVTVGTPGQMADLGNEQLPGIIVTNGEFARLRFPIPEAKVGPNVFTSTVVGSAGGLTLSRLPELGATPETFVVDGGSKFTSQNSLFRSELKTVFGGSGTTGLELFPISDSYRMSFSLASQFLLGNNLLVQSAGARIDQDSNKKLILSGGAFIDLNPSSAHSVSEVNAGTAKPKGSLVRGRFALDYSHNIAANELTDDPLNFFLTDPTSTDKRHQGIQIFDYALMGRHPSQNPLRLTIGSNSETLQGAFTMAAGGGALNGTIEPVALTGGKLPSTPLLVDFSPVPGEASGFVAYGVLLNGGPKVALTEELNLSFSSASYNGATLASGSGGGSSLTDITSPQDVVAAVGGTPSGSHPVTAALDNQDATKYANTGGAGSGLEITPSVGSTLVTGIVIRTANDSPDSDPASYKLEGKAAGGQYELVAEGALSLPAARDTLATEIKIASAKAYTSYRLTFPTLKGGSSTMQIAELQLVGLQATAVADVTSPKDQVMLIGGSTPPNEGPARAVDNLTATKYFNISGARSGLEVTLAGGPSIVRGFALKTANDVPGRDPTRYRIEGRDANGNFVLISEGALVPPTGRHAWTPTIAFTNTSAYSTYRLTFPEIRTSGQGLQLSEMQLLGVAAPGVSTASLNVKGRHLKGASIKSTSPRTVGDLTFQTLNATLDSSTVPPAWRLRGPATYFGQQFDVGKPGANNPQALIGGSSAGAQLRLISLPDPTPPASFPAPNVIRVAGLSFDVTKLTPKGTPLEVPNVSKTYTFTSPDYTVMLGGTELALNLEVTFKVSNSGVSIESFSGTLQQNSEIKLGNATIQVTSLSVKYDLSKQQLEISGSAMFKFMGAGSNVEMTVTLGDAMTPGLVIKDGVVESFKGTIDGSFEILKLSGEANGLTVEYNKAENEFKIYGGITVSTQTQSGFKLLDNLSVMLGDENMPGIVIKGGSLERLDFTVNGDINIFSITASPKDLRVHFDRPSDKLQITGELAVTLAPNLTVTAGLPGEGLLINTKTGMVEVRGLSLKADSDLKFGVLTIKGLHIDYQDSGGTVSIEAGAEVELPSGLSVGGSFKIVNGKLDSIGIVFEKNPGIIVAKVINIYRLDVKVEGLSDLNNFKITGKVNATVGPLVKFAGQSFAYSDIEGTIEITPTYLRLTGQADFVGGLYGSGSFDGKLDWSSTTTVTFSGNVSYYGGIVNGSISARIDVAGNVDFKGSLGSKVPDAVPFVGGKSLGDLTVELRVRPAEAPSASYARFSARISSGPLTVSGRLKLDFGGDVHYGLGVRFQLDLPWPLPDIDWSRSVDGKFKLFDGTRPTIEVLAAAGIAGSPHGEIVYNAQTPLPDGTFIDLYADHDNMGNDGVLIASGIPYQSGSQTYQWNDMATFAAPGEPVYVYAVVTDGENASVYSDYSSKFTVTPGFVPTLANPTKVQTGFGDAIEFATTHGRAITVSDPRSSHDANAFMEVTLSAAKGTLDFPAIPPNVTYSGNGTQELVIEGTAAAITAALDGLLYLPDPLADAAPDAIEISVLALPGEMAPPVTGKIDVEFESVGLFFRGSNAGLDIGGDLLGLEAEMIVAGEFGQTPLDQIEIQNLKTEFLTGAQVKINNFEMGKEFLELPMNTTFTTGIHATFSTKTGMLTLTGPGRIEDYEFALSQVVYDTMTTEGSKSLEVSLLDHAGSKGKVTVPLTVVPGPTPPKLDVGVTGLSYPAGSGPLFITDQGTITVPDGETIEALEIAFLQDSFVPGEDKLSFAAANFNADLGTDLESYFDDVTGVLTIFGTASADQWNMVLQAIDYESLGGANDIPLTEGPRYLKVIVMDGLDNMSSAFLVVDVAENETPNLRPELLLSTDMVTLGAHDDMLGLDPELTLNSEAPALIGAQVAIVDGYMQGDYELAVGTTWPNLTTEWDPMDGVLHIRGVATPYEYEDMLRSVKIVAMAGRRTPTNLSLTFSVNDGLSATETDPFHITVETAPFLQADLDNITPYTKGRELVRINDGFWIDTDDELMGATIKIAGGYHPGEDELVFDPPGGVTGLFISGDFDSATGVLTLDGLATALDYEEAFRHVYYRSTRYNPVAGDRVIQYQVVNTVAVSNVLDAFVTVTPEVVPPMVDIGQSGSFTEDGSEAALLPNLTISSRDSSTPFMAAPDMLYGATVDIKNWVAGEDELRWTTTGAIMVNYNADEGSLVLSGAGSFDEYQNVLRSVMYRNTSQAPTTAARQVSVRVQQNGASGLDAQTMSTFDIVATPDPITVQAGTIDPVEVMANASPASLGLEDMQYSSDALASDPLGTTSLTFTPTQLPDDLVGQVVLSDGTTVTLGESYDLARLRDLRFVPASGGMGSTSLVFSIDVFDAANGNVESQNFTQTITINVKGVATATSAEAYMSQVHRHLLHGNPDAATLSNLATQLNEALRRVGRDNGFGDDAAARATVVEAIVNGSMYRTQAITTLYQDLLGRMPTTDELAATTELSALKLQLVASNEFLLLHNSAGFSSYVSAVYQTLLSRVPTSAELALGQQALNAGHSLTAYVDSLGVFGVTEEQRQAIFQDLLSRAATFDDLFDFDSSSSQALTVSILSSDEYYARYAMPSTSSHMRTRATTGHEAVGIVGDVSGGHATGTLIAPQYVLVAAHTVYETPPGQITFTVGGSTQHIEKLHVHPQFNPDVVGLNETNDLAILKLRQPVSGVTPALLTGTSPKLGDVLTLVGYGQHDGALFGTKREGSTPPVLQVEPNVFRWQQHSAVQNDADPGDSGAPLFATIEGTPYIAGIVSGGTGEVNEIGDIGTNTRVDSYLDWIQSVVGSLNVTDVADAPSLIFETDELFVDENAGETRVLFMVSASDTVTYSITSDRPTMFTSLAIDEDGGPNGNLVFETDVNQRGTAEISVTATSHGMSTTKTLAVTAEERNDPPSIDPITPMLLDVSPGEQIVTLTGLSGGIGETDPFQISITGVEPAGFFSTTSLDPVGSSEATRVLRFTPADGVLGEGVISVEVREAGADGQYNTSDDRFTSESLVVLTTENKVPTLDAIPRYQIMLSEHTIDLSGIGDGDGRSQLLQVFTSSSDNSVVITELTYDPAVPTVGELKLLPAKLGSSIVTVRVTDAGDDGLFDSSFFTVADDRTYERTFQVDVVTTITSWTNPDVVEDVDGDGVIAPIDALVLINRLNDVGVGVLPARNVLQPPFYDTNQDGEVAPIDALIVINRLNGNDQSSQNGEGEDVPRAFPIAPHFATAPTQCSFRLNQADFDVREHDSPIPRAATAVELAPSGQTAWEGLSTEVADDLVAELALRPWSDDLVDRTLLEWLDVG